MYWEPLLYFLKYYLFWNEEILASFLRSQMTFEQFSWGENRVKKNREKFTSLRLKCLRHLSIIFYTSSSRLPSFSLSPPETWSSFCDTDSSRKSITYAAAAPWREARVAPFQSIYTDLKKNNTEFWRRRKFWKPWALFNLVKILSISKVKHNSTLEETTNAIRNSISILWYLAHQSILCSSTQLWWWMKAAEMDQTLRKVNNWALIGSTSQSLKVCLVLLLTSEKLPFTMQ